MFQKLAKVCGLVRSEAFFPKAVNVELGLGGPVRGGRSVFPTKEMTHGGGGMWLEIGGRLRSLAMSYSDSPGGVM